VSQSQSSVAMSGDGDGPDRARQVADQMHPPGLEQLGKLGDRIARQDAFEPSCVPLVSPTVARTRRGPWRRRRIERGISSPLHLQMLCSRTWDCH
jgi:hypothetical protein